MTSATPKPRAGEHTKGPWEIFGATHIWSRSAKANIASCSALRTIQHVGYAPPKIGDIEETAANARRIVACVNACEGISTEDLELNLHPGAAQSERDLLRERERELVEALRYWLPDETYMREHYPSNSPEDNAIWMHFYAATALINGR